MLPCCPHPCELYVTTKLGRKVLCLASRITIFLSLSYWLHGTTVNEGMEKQTNFEHLHNLKKSYRRSMKEKIRQ